MGYLDSAATFIEIVGDYLIDLASWLEKYVGNWANPVFMAGYYCYDVASWFELQDDYVDGIYNDAKKAIGDASDALSGVLDLTSWKDTVQSIIDWADDLSNNFYGAVRDQVTDVFTDISNIYTNFDTWARSALDDIITTVQDLDLNFNWKVWDYAQNWFNRIDDVWDNWNQRVFDTLGQDWTDTVNFVRGLPGTFLDPVHNQLGSWLPEFQEQIYGYITARVDNFWQVLRTKIDEKVDEQAEWWFSLAEKIIEKV